MKHLDLFSGYGGFTIACEELGIETIGFSEVDKYANAVLKYHYPNIKNYGDIRTIDLQAIDNFDLLTAGFPCQAFSIAGNRKGFEDTRGTLIYDVFRVLEAKRPRVCVLENVKGLLSHDNGRTFKTIITSLAELGYSVEWQVLNAKNFGVPQNRERVFIIGYFGGLPRRKVFPIQGIDESANLKYVGAIMSEQNQKWLEDGKQLSRNFPQGQRVYRSDGIASTIASQAGGLGAKTGLYQVCPTIRATQHKSGDNQTVVADGMKIRRLTPTECERLMGLPDGWTKGVSDTQRYKLCGNGVVVNVVKEIMKSLLNKS